MGNQDINTFTQEKICTYRDETYSVRDNGSVLRHSRENGRKRKDDDIWTFGTSIDDKGFYSFEMLKFSKSSRRCFLEIRQIRNMLFFTKITTSRTIELKILRGLRNLSITFYNRKYRRNLGL